MATVRWTVGAQNDLQALVAYITQGSAAYAATMSGRIVAATERLERFPELGRIVPEYEDPSLRELVVRDYRVVYRIRGGDVLIAAIVHGTRNLLKRLPTGPWEIE